MGTPSCAFCPFFPAKGFLFCEIRGPFCIHCSWGVATNFWWRLRQGTVWDMTKSSACTFWYGPFWILKRVLNHCPVVEVFLFSVLAFLQTMWCLLSEFESKHHILIESVILLLVKYSPYHCNASPKHDQSTKDVLEVKFCTNITLIIVARLFPESAKSSWWSFAVKWRFDLSFYSPAVSKRFPLMTFSCFVSIHFNSWLMMFEES